MFHHRLYFAFSFAGRVGMCTCRSKFCCSRFVKSASLVHILAPPAICGEVTAVKMQRVIPGLWEKSSEWFELIEPAVTLDGRDR